MMLRRKLALVAGVALGLASIEAGAAAQRYPSPVEVAVSQNGKRLFIVCEGTDEVVVYDTSSHAVARRIAVGRAPKDLTLSPDGKRLYVANSWSDTVSEIDAQSLEVVRNLATGFEPNAAMVDRAQRYLYVANRISGDVSVVDLATGQETKRLVAGRGASYLALSSDGSKVYCTHIY
ncbi:MAG: YncE family protein, partial [Tepidisphaerales bacterium]